MFDTTLNDPSLIRQQGYINGEWRSAYGQDVIPVINPATSEVLGAIPKMGAGETQEAIKAAHNAWYLWKAKTAKERSNLLRQWHDLILENQEDLAKILTLEQGKPLTESLSEIAYGASYIEWYAEEAKRVYGDLIPSHQYDKRILVFKESVGVVAAITPWNFPHAMVTRKIAPALAAGCPVVLKPASQTPFSALALAVLAERAGFPRGILNIVTGSATEIGHELSHSTTVRKLSFTGSTAVGKLLMQQCADSVKKVSLELGGNAPFIVFDDADLDAAVEAALASKYRNSGQTCVCTNRFFIHETIYDSFAEKFVESVKQLTVGNGLDPAIQQGPLIDEQAVRKVEEHIEDAIEKGGFIQLGGKRHVLGHTFFEPTIISHASTTMKVAQEETFGPLAALIPFSTESEVIQMANDTPFGLAAYFFSRDIGRVWRVSEALEYGIVGINTGLISTEVAPFGGIKESGIGREGSKYGLDDYLELKYVCLGGINPTTV